MPESIGTPETMLLKATPQSRAGIAEPAMIIASMRARQLAESTLPRYSTPMPRMISPTRMSSRGR